MWCNKNIVFILLLSCASYAHSYKAVCIVPVADLMGQPIETFKLADAETSYNNLPVAWGHDESDRKVCPRVHQLLFNEVVEVISETEVEAEIEVSSCYYFDLRTQTKQNKFWMQKKHLLPIKEQMQKAIPEPISFKIKNIEEANRNVVTLILPFFDKDTLFSVGTRFVLKDDLPDYYEVLALQQNEINALKIPKKYALLACYQNHPMCQKAMVQMLKMWTNNEGFVPYVWGGCSLTEKFKEHIFVEKETKDLEGKLLHYWQYINHEYGVFSGFDCSNLILRACQIFSIPFFLKNSTTMHTMLRSIEKDEQLEAGDLIWFKGHVQVISDIENDLLIESRGYAAGFGKLQEIKLSKVFKDIYSYQDLLAAFFDHKPLFLLNADGSIRSTIDNFKILKLSSCYDIKN